MICPLEICNLPQPITELVTKSHSVIEVLFWLFPFSIFFCGVLLSLHLCFPGPCRDIHTGELKYQLNSLFFPFLLKYAELSVCLTDGSSERGEKDASKITTYPPGAVRFDCELRAVQVSCGFHHSGKLVFLTVTFIGLCAYNLMKNRKCFP